MSRFFDVSIDLSEAADLEAARARASRYIAVDSRLALIGDVVVVFGDPWQRSHPEALRTWLLEGVVPSDAFHFPLELWADEIRGFSTLSPGLAEQLATNVPLQCHVAYAVGHREVAALWPAALLDAAVWTDLARRVEEVGLFVTHCVEQAPTVRANAAPTSLTMVRCVADAVATDIGRRLIRPALTLAPDSQALASLGQVRPFFTAFPRAIDAISRDLVFWGGYGPLAAIHAGPARVIEDLERLPDVLRLVAPYPYTVDALVSRFRSTAFSSIGHQLLVGFIPTSEVFQALAANPDMAPVVADRMVWDAMELVRSGEVGVAARIVRQMDIITSYGTADPGAGSLLRALDTSIAGYPSMATAVRRLQGISREIV